MSIRTQLVRVVTAVSIVVPLVLLASPASATAVSPVTYLVDGQWGPSNNVDQDTPCAAPSVIGSTCNISADSMSAAPVTLETCLNEGEVITTPVRIATNFGCNVSFSATLTAKGAGTVVAGGGNEVDPNVIAVGACAGYTISDATITVTDNIAGTYAVPVKATVTNLGWTLQGQYTYVDVSRSKAFVLNAAGTISPGCVKLRNGNIRFTGLFSGNYQFA